MRELDRTRYLSKDELGTLLRAVRDRSHRNARRDLALFALLGTAGIRPSEALNLRIADLHLTDRDPWLRVRRLKTRRPGGTIDDLPISRSLARTMRRYLGARVPDLEGRVFPMSLRNAELLFHHYARRAGLTGFRLYALRHTALTLMHRACGDLRLVQAMAGHSSPSTTAIYAHVAPEQRRRLAEAVGSAL